jgi:hypothetical protein
MSERASQARQRRVRGPRDNRGAISWGAGAERAPDERSAVQRRCEEVTA